MKKTDLGGAPRTRATFVLPKPLDHELEIFCAVHGLMKSEALIAALRKYFKDHPLEEIQP